MVFVHTLILALASTVAAIEPSCPSGYVSGYNGQTLDIIAQPSTVWKLIGDFGNLTWAGVTQVNLSDASMDNVPGVMRYSIQLGLSINETLIIYDAYNTTTMVGSETHTVAPFSTLPLLNTTVSAYSDSVTVSPLCGGLSTRMTFNVGFCTIPGYEPAVSSLFTQAHYGQLKNAQAILGAANYTDSSCAALKGAFYNGTMTTNGSSTNLTSSSPGIYLNTTTSTGAGPASQSTTIISPGVVGSNSSFNPGATSVSSTTKASTSSSSSGGSTASTPPNSTSSASHFYPSIVASTFMIALMIIF